jgi:hypothetical protein
VNPDRISAIAEMGPIKNVKDIQLLMECLVVRNWFVSWLGECGLPLYKLLKKSDSFHWTEEAQKALDELKTHITKSPVLALPKLGETLLYVAATTQVISATLVVEGEEPGHVYKVQKSIYYINKILSNCKTRYNQVQNLLYVVSIMKHKFLHYFKSHLIHVVTSHGLMEIVGNHLTTRRIAKWALKLMALDITYVPQTTIESQVLVHFMAEWTKT